MTSVKYYDDQKYQTRSMLTQTEGFVLATAVSGAVMSPLAYIDQPFLRQLRKNESDNHIYRDYFQKAFDKSGLRKLGVGIIPAQLLHKDDAYKRGTNACFIPESKQVLINTDKIASAGFHELGHALNALKSKYGVKYLAKLRAPGYAIAGLMEYFALFSRTKPKGAPRSFTDIIEDNCGKIAFIAMLPVVAEEAIASIRGKKQKKSVDMGKPFINNLKKLYMKALATYGGRAVLGGFAVYASRKVMDYFTRPKPVE